MSLFEDIMKVVETTTETTTEWKRNEIKKLMQALTQGDCLIEESFIFTNVTRNDMVRALIYPINQRIVTRIIKEKVAEGMSIPDAREFARSSLNEAETLKKAEQIVDQFTEDEIEQAVAQTFENQETTVTTEVLNVLVYNVFNKGAISSYLMDLGL